MTFSFEDDVFAFELESRLGDGSYEYWITVPALHEGTALRDQTVTLHYADNGKVRGRLVEVAEGRSEIGWFSHLKIETADLAGVLAAEATRNLLAA